MPTLTETDFLTALYRGLLRREPDTLGLAAHAETLRAATDDRALVATVQAFLGSEEFGQKQQAGDLLRQMVPQTGVYPAPPFAHVASLGSHCYTSWLLKQDGLKRYSGPFDWIFSNLSMVQHCIEDDFKRFLDRAEYEVRPEASRPRPGEGVCDHRFYRDQFGVELVFNHYDPNQPDAHTYFTRAVERFRRLLASSDRKLFLAISTDDRIKPTDFPQLAELIDRVTQNAQLLVFRVLPASRDARVFGFTPLDRRGAHHLLAYQPTSPLTGLGFGDPFDDLMMRRQLRTMKFELADTV